MALTAEQKRAAFIKNRDANFQASLRLEGFSAGKDTVPKDERPVAVRIAEAKAKYAR